MDRAQVAMLTISEIKRRYNEGMISRSFVRDLVYYGFITPAAYNQIVNE